MANDVNDGAQKRKPGRPPVIKTPPAKPEVPPVAPFVPDVPVEKVNTGIKDGPLVDIKPEEASKGVAIRTCPNHPESEATTYGMCTKCYDKLTKAKKRKLYLSARLHGSNAHNYPIELRRVWRREVALIDAGLWKKPLKIKAKTKLAEALMG